MATAQSVYQLVSDPTQMFKSARLRMEPAMQTAESSWRDCGHPAWKSPTSSRRRPTTGNQDVCMVHRDPDPPRYKHQLHIISIPLTTADTPLLQEKSTHFQRSILMLAGKLRVILAGNKRYTGVNNLLNVVT